ncbi:MAG: hypothetical protein M1820_009970 [Bogoriella megaspora]|nr:MAG: hypothetical protein M1820_009970 [Bogoriella megaspora]
MGEEGDLVSGDGWVSEESSFYGDDGVKTELEERSDELSTQKYWSDHASNLAVIAHVTRNKPKEEPVAAASLYNPFEGQDFHARQLGESVAEFTKRLPPLESTKADVGAWIWIANPHAEKDKPGDERAFIEAGEALLEKYVEDRSKLEAQFPGKPKGTITKKMGPAKDALVEAIDELAVQTGLTIGKWMLRPSFEELPRVWRLVAEAVVDGKLGPLAKVPPEGSTDHSSGESVVIVYTYDFTDQKDVKRVLQELHNMDLVPGEGGGKPIYYKTDAYTTLGIKSDNPYNLRASTYKSDEVMRMKPKEKRQAIGKARKEAVGKGKMTTLDAFFKKS